MRHKSLSAFVLCIFFLGGLVAQGALGQNAPAASSPSSSAATQPAPVKFNFRGATYQQVIDFFSRATGLPVIWETAAPEGTLEYVSPEAYELPEALHVLNIVLQSKGVMLRVDNQKLFLQKLDQMAKENIPTFVGTVPATVTDDQIVTVVRPLKIALAKPMAEKLAAMVATYGSVTAMEQQNALIITETAGQVHRLLGLVEQLDKEDPEGIVEIFRIENAKAKDLMGPLTSLLATKVEKYVVNDKGQQVKIEENQMPGLTISADERTNSIIAKGVQSKIDKLREAIKLLDAPGAGQGRNVKAISLTRTSAADAAAKLHLLYQKLPEKERPTVLALDDVGKVVIVGDDDDVRDGTSLINTLEGGAASPADLQSAIAVINLDKAKPAQVIAAVASLLNKRQQASVKLIAGADDKSIIAAGLSGDIETVKSLVPVLDRQAAPDRQARLIRIAQGDAAQVVAKAKTLYDAQRAEGDESSAVTADLDATSRLLTVVGGAKAVEAFTATVKMVESSVVIDREARRFELANVLPSEIIAPLASLATPLLQPADGGQYAAPAFAAVDSINTLVVTATPEQFTTLASLIQSLDVPAGAAGPNGGRPPMRIVRLRVADAANLAGILNTQYGQRPPAERKAKPVNVSADGSTNSLILAAHPDVLPEIQAMISELDKTERLDVEGREIRIFPLKVARADELARTIDEMYPPPPPPVDARGRPQPQLQKPREIVVRADAQTNSLIIDAPVQRMPGFEQLVEQLDRQQIIAETQVRTYQVKHADLDALANTLRQLASAGTLNPTGQDRRVGIAVSTEPVSQTVIVSGPAEIFARVDQVMKDLDVKRAGPATTLRFFKLEHAKADNIAGMLREVLTTRIAQDVPEAAGGNGGGAGASASVQSLLNVTADRKTNTLIISAPEAVMPAAEQLIKQLDGGTASIGDPVVRVKPLTFADAAGVSSSLGTAIAGMTSKTTGEPVAVKLIPAPGSNALILVGLEADLAEVEALIEPLDARPATDAMDAKTFALQHASAVDIGPVVQRLLADQQETDPRIVIERLRRSRGQIDSTPRIRVEADARTNSLIVSGTQQVVSLAQALIKQLDAADESSDRTYATYTPVNADPAALALGVKKVLDATRPSGRPSTVELLAEPQSGAIVVVGPQEETARAVELLKRRDGESLVAPQMDFRIVRLKNAPADMVSKALVSLLSDRSRWPQKLLAAARANLTIGQPVAVADPANNRIMVSAPTDLMPLADQLIAQIDQPRAEGDGVQVRVFNLAQASAADIAAALKTALDARAAAQPGRTRAVVAAEPSSNSVIVTAAADDMKEIESLIKPLDEFGGSGGGDQSQVRTVFLKHARAENVAPVVEKLLNSEQIPVAIRYDAIRNNRPLPPSGPQVRVAADNRLNAVMIAAPHAMLLVAEQMATQLDVDPGAVAGAETRSVRVLGVDNADAAQLAANLEAIFSAPDQADSKPTIRVDEASNSLLVRATDAQFKTIEDVVRQIDKATIASSRQMRMVPIDPAKGDAAEIARALQEMLDRAGAGGGGNKVQVITLDELLKRKKSAEAGEKPPGPKATSMRIDDQRLTIDDCESGSGRSLVRTDRPIVNRRSSIVNSPVLALASLAFAAVETRPADQPPPVTIAVDKETNSLILLGSPRSIERVTALAKQLQDQLPALPGTVRCITLPDAVDATALAAMINQVVEKIAPAAGKPGDLKKRVAVIADAATNSLIVAANDPDFETVADLIGALSKPANAEIPVRTIVLRHAEAGAVAKGIQQFYDDRAKMTPAGRNRADKPRRVSIMGIESTNTLLVAAVDEEFQQVEQLVAQFDTPEASEALTFKVFQLKNAKATEIERTVQRLVDDLTYNQGNDFIFFWPPQNQNNSKKKDSIAVRADARLNTLIVTGRGDKFDVVGKMIDILDAPPPEGEERIVKVYRVKHAQLQTVADVVQEVFNQGRQPRRSWEPPDPTQIRVRTDDASNTLIVSATGKEQADIAQMIAGLDDEVGAAGAGGQPPQVLPVKFARAADLATTLTRFLADRAKAANAPRPTATIVASDTVNTLIVAAPQEELATIRDLLARLDQPDVTGDRVVEILALQQGKAEEIARILKEQFGRRAVAGNASSLIVTADARTNSIIINAPQQEFAQAKALIERLDAPSDADETIIRTYALTDAIADQAVKVLTQTLQLDARGQTPGKGITIKIDDVNAPSVEVKARIVADKRSNSLVVTATEPSFPVIEALIKRLDTIPAKNPQEWRIIPLKFAMASDVAATLTQITRGMDDGAGPPKIDVNRLDNRLIIAATADQFRQIDGIITQIDQPAEQQRITDFVALKFAQAQKIQEALSVFYGQNAAEADTPGKKNVRIVADPATNSLVISAEKDEWEGVRALITRLDSAEYDSSLQLKVLPLVYADAQSVARAINDAFQATVQRGGGNRGGGGGNRPQGFPFDFFGGGSNTTLVQADEWVRASAEPQTNAVIVSASRQNLTKVEQIVKQLDIADYAKLPPPRIIPVTAGDPVQFAQSLTQLYLESRPQGGAGGSGFPPLHIVGNAAANSIIVRAEKEDYEQIKALAEALQQQASSNGLTVNVLKLSAAPAARVAASITEAYQAKAKQSNQPLSIRVDAVGNSLVVASTAPLFNEIKASVAQLDAIAPAAGQGIFIIDLQNVSSETARNVIQTIGLDKPQPADSTSRLVSEPVKVSLLAGRNAVVIVGNPADKETILGLLKAIDAEPPLADAQTRLIRLKHAQAEALAGIVNQLLRPADQQADTALAQALREQTRRLAVRQGGDAGAAAAELDLTKPVRVVPDPALNALVVSSTEKNVAALERIVAMFDQLPITDKVTVQIYPLQNIAAEQFARILKDLFTQGKEIGKTAVTKVQGVPDGAVGKALLDELLISTDERTNTVIVAGTEEAIALVEVLSKRIDSDVAAGWVEPKVIPLRYADAVDLATTLQAIIVEGTSELPQSSPLQRQVGRLRMARMGGGAGAGAAGAGSKPPAAAPGGNPPAVLEADVFVPMTRLVIRAEPQMNALILVGTPDNLEVVGELVAMLDIEAASPANAVRIYPVENASAARLAQTVRTLFDQQVQSKAIRPEDRVIVQADERTNALVVATSPRSFAVLEVMLKTLDSKLAPELREIRTIEVKNSSAARLATLIQQMMDARLDRLRKVQPESADLEKAAIAADPRTNSLVVAAGNDSWEVIKRLAADLDANTIGEASMIQVIPVDKGNADRLAQTITKVMERRYADLPAELRSSQRPLVQTDPRSNSLLVAANPEDMAAIQDLVTRIAAVPVNPAVGMNLIPLVATTRAELIAPRLQRLMQERAQTLGAAGTPSDRVSIEADPGSNSLIVAASDENFQVVKSLVDVLVQAEAGGKGRDFEVVSLNASRASDVIGLLNDLYVQEANRTRGAGTIKVSADERLNAVLINAPEADVHALKDLIAQLDGAKPAGVVEIKYIPLQSANALETVSLIENVLSGRGIGTRRGTRQATVLKYLREIGRERKGAETQPQATQPADDLEPVEMEVSAAIRESITLTPDLRTNTIIVSAPRESVTMIERMIRDLDESNTGSKSIRIFKLVNADAVAMAEILTDLFRLKQGSNLYVLKPREDGGSAPMAAPGGGAAMASPGPDVSANAPVSVESAGGVSGTELTAVPDERQQLSITVDSRTNSLIVSGTPTYLDLVAKVVEDLDKLEANEREVFVYQLRNAVALDVAKVLNTFVEQEQKKLVGTLSADQLGSTARLLEREITIQGDEKSNTVLVSASPRYMDRVKDMIKKLDVDPPQVLIQVMLAEVTLDSTDEWGVDMRIGGHVGGADITAGYGLASAFVTGMGVPNLAITSSDFDLLIRAMQSQGRLQVLSNPSIMAANNALARIQVGETVQVPSTTSISDAGQTSTTLEKEDLGVILKVTPSINPDGFVRMTINPEISNLSDRTTQISSDFQSPIITRRTADTTVTVHDGQTVVIGGLISDRYERRDRKVPVLGDFPIIGPLFRSNTENTAKTELLIVLTPHVIESPTEFDRVGEITDAEIDRLSLPQDVKDSIRKGLLDGTGGLFDSRGNRIDVKSDRSHEQNEKNGVPWK